LPGQNGKIKELFRCAPFEGTRMDEGTKRLKYLLTTLLRGWEKVSQRLLSPANSYFILEQSRPSQPASQPASHCLQWCALKGRQKKD
jgi:hypothetical protein